MIAEVQLLVREIAELVKGRVEGDDALSIVGVAPPSPWLIDWSTTHSPWVIRCTSSVLH